jgi:hypothetical protein
MAAAVIEIIRKIFDTITAIGFGNCFAFGFGGDGARLGWHGDLPDVPVCRLQAEGSRRLRALSIGTASANRDTLPE